MSHLTPNKFPKGESCGNCRFAGTHVDAGAGQERVLVACHRFPPSRLGQVAEFNPEGGVVQAWKDTGWPVTTWDDWCGGWQERSA